MLELVNPVGCKVGYTSFTADLSGSGATYRGSPLKSAFFEQFEQSSAQIDDHANTSFWSIQ